MRLTVLGSSGTAPQQGNPASGYLLRSAAAVLWVDAGPGTYQALLEHVDPEDIDAVLLSHMHSDHCTDLFALAHNLMFVRRSERRLPVVAPAGSVDRMRGFLGGEADHPTFRTLDVAEPAPGEAFVIGDVTATAQAAHHSVPAFAYRIETAGGALGYTGDTGPSEMINEHFAGVDVLLAEASLQDASPEYAFHMTARQAADMAVATNAGRLLLTHIPEAIDAPTSLEEAKTAFGGTIGLAEPGKTYIIGAND